MTPGIKETPSNVYFIQHRDIKKIEKCFLKLQTLALRYMVSSSERYEQMISTYMFYLTLTLCIVHFWLFILSFSLRKYEEIARYSRLPKLDGESSRYDTAGATEIVTCRLTGGEANHFTFWFFLILHWTKQRAKMTL